jgi:hypothetical protein
MRAPPLLLAAVLLLVPAVTLAQDTLKCRAVATKSPMCEDIERTCTTRADGDDLSALNENNYKQLKGSCELSLEIYNDGDSDSKQKEAEKNCPESPSTYLSQQRSRCSVFGSQSKYCSAVGANAKLGAPGVGCETDDDCGLIPCFAKCRECFDENACEEKVKQAMFADKETDKCSSAAGRGAVAAAAALAAAVLAVVL